LFTVFFRRRYIVAGGETVAAAKAVIKGPCPRLISLRPLLRPCKGKRLHPLAIKAKENKKAAREEGRERRIEESRQEKKEKEKEGGRRVNEKKNRVTQQPEERRLQKKKSASPSS